MDDSCQIWLVRHGQTDWNIEKRLQGHLDIPLNQTGMEQAEKVALYMCKEHQDKPFSNIYSR